jgi:hypothetical protein
MARDFTKNTSNYVSLGINNINPVLSGAAFISGFCWFKKDTHGTGGDSDRVLDVWIDNSNTGLTWRLRSSSINRVDITARSGTGDSSQNAVASTVLNTGQRYASGFTIDYPNNDIFMYTHGVLDGFNVATGFGNTTYVPGTPTTAADSIGSFFNGGTSPDGTDRQLDGAIAHLALWATPVSSFRLLAQDHEALARGALPRQVRPDSLVLWFPLWGLDSPERDLASKKSATITGTVGRLATDPPTRPLGVGRLRHMEVFATTGQGPLLGLRRNHLIRSVYA